MEVVVNAGAAEFYLTSSVLGREVLLPPYGFLIAGRQFVAFNALEFEGMRYREPTFFTLRSLDGRPLSVSSRVRAFHGFGDNQVNWRNSVHSVPREAMLSHP